jgi:hypothetical protein
MKKIFQPLFASILLLALVIPALADTIRLKDGSVIHGQVVGFKDGQFTVLIGSGSKGRRGRTTIYVEDIESIEFDNVTGNVAAAPAGDNTNLPTNSSEPMTQPSRPNPTPEPSNNSDAVSTPPSSGAALTFFTIKVSVRGDNVNNGWTNSGLVVRRGQRIRITASGRVSLKKDVWTTPSGIPTLRDDNKLMRTEATGELIGVIGDDNDDFIPVGARREFVAQRDGVLFLGVNEGDLTDNTGSFDVVIEAEAGSSAPR